MVCCFARHAACYRCCKLEPQAVPDSFERLKTALADRYAIEHERTGRKALPKGLKIQPNDHVGKQYDAVMRVFAPYVTV